MNHVAVNRNEHPSTERAVHEQKYVETQTSHLTTVNRTANFDIKNFHNRQCNFEKEHWKKHSENSGKSQLKSSFKM